MVLTQKALRIQMAVQSREASGEARISNTEQSCENENSNPFCPRDSIGGKDHCKKICPVISVPVGHKEEAP